MVGCAYMFTAADPFAGVDLDACVDEQGDLAAHGSRDRAATRQLHNPSARRRCTGVHVIAQLRGDRRHGRNDLNRDFGRSVVSHPSSSKPLTPTWSSMTPPDTARRVDQPRPMFL
jgi:hypothetical protein